MLRTILAVLYVTVYLLFSMLLEPVIWLIGRSSPEKRDYFIMNWVKHGFRCIGAISGIRVTAKGRENIPTDRAVVFAANHRGFFDVIASYPLMVRPTGFLAKIEFARIPLLRFWMKNIHCLFLDRKDTKQGLETILKAIEKVKSGRSVFLFPEGTRSRTEGEFLPFHTGSFKIAIRAGAPVIPVTIVGAGAILDDHMPKICPGHIIIDFGEPIETAGMKPAERGKLPEQVRERIMARYREEVEQL